MSIASRIEAMEQHLTDDYSVLEVAGADLTNVDKNIVNLKLTWQERLLYFINNGTNVVWNNWEKVEGTGETLTLNSTEEAPMKINLKGNTSQESTTGSQLIDFTTLSNSNTTNSFVNDILTVNTSSGTYANAFKDITSIYKSNSSKVLRFDFTSLNSSTDLTGQNGYVRLRIVKTDNSVTNVNLVNTDKSISTHTIPNDVSDISSTSLTIYANNTNTAMTNTVTINKPILHFGSTSTDYEPYTNGASPNPDYPQDIHVVSGDNEINVTGRNLLEGIEYGEINSNSGVESGSTTVIRGTNYIPYDTSSTYYVSVNSTLASVGINCRFYNASKEYLGWSTLTGSGRNLYINIGTGVTTTDLTPKYFKFRQTLSAGPITSLNDNVMITKVNDMNYEPFGNTYNIDLPVENLFDDSTTTNILIADNGEEQPNTNIKTSTYIKVNPNSKYTYSCEILQGQSAGWEKFSYYDVNKSYLSYLYTTDKNKTITLPTNCEYVRIGYHTNFVTNVQLEKGTKYNSFTPYGTTPIELCKIGDYQDSIKKSTGKNLFDKNNLTIEIGTISATGSFDYSTERVRSYWIEVKENTTYKISTSNSDLQIVPYYYNSSKTFISFDSGWKNFPFTFTTPVNTKYVAFLFKNSTNNPTPSSLTNIMLNEGSTALPYEPYGKVWYLNKQIGKVILNGTENWGSFQVESSGLGRAIVNNMENVYYDNNLATLLSDKLVGTKYAGAWNNTYECIATFNNNRFIAYLKNVSDLATFKSILNNSNAIVYYVLATPTYTEITDSTLLSQLEVLNGAKSYTTQTNISQENNDKPFILDVTALKQLTQ